MLQISPSAVKEIQRIQRNKIQPDSSLKLTISSGGCSGLFYELKLENKERSKNSDGINIQSTDRLIEVDGVSVVVDANSWQYLEYLEIHYAEDIMGGGFRFHNPLAKNICGCGISFAIA